MQTAESPMIGAPKLWPRSGRIPLQPKNSPATPLHDRLIKTKPKPKQERIKISVIEDSNKENHPIQLDPVDASLGEELIAMKKKLERLRMEKERTERMLKERDRMLDDKMKEVELRGEFQKRLEMEVDRLFRLKELKCRSMVRTAHAYI